MYYCIYEIKQYIFKIYFLKNLQLYQIRERFIYTLISKNTDRKK